MKLINICGANRSGTTMLDLMLGNAPNAFSCGEVYALYRPTRTHHFLPKCSCSNNICPYWNEIKNYSEKEFHQKLMMNYGFEFIIDSSKDLAWVFDNNVWYSNSNVSVINIVIWKDPVEYAYSIWKREKSLTSWKHRYYKYYKRFIDLALPFHSVNYRDMMNDPASRLKDLCSLIGMKYFPGKEEFWEKEHHHLFGSLGTRKQVENKSSYIRKGEEYDPLFAKKKASLDKYVHDDKKLNDVIYLLKSNDISVMSQTSSKKIKKRVIYPAWYYIHKMVQNYRKLRPEVWPYDQ